MPVLQAGQNGRDQGLQDFFFPNSAQEAQRHTPDVLVGMLQVVAQILADQDLQPRGPSLSMRNHLLVVV